MIGEIFSEHPWLGPLIWQSTLCLAVGLAGSFLLRRRPARAHQLLLIGLLASGLMPGSYAIVKQLDLGLLIENAAPAQQEAIATPPAPEAEAEIVFVPQRHDVSVAPSISERSVLPATTGTKALVIPWYPVALLFWIATSALLLAHLGLRFALGVRLLRTAAPMQSERLGQAVETANRRLGIRAAVWVRGSERIHSPVIWCWTPVPVLLVPANAPDDESDTDWAGIFCHELAHWQRLDHVSGLVAELLACALPWHPLVWWARHRLLRLSEQACDDWVLAGGQAGVDYAESLLGLSAERRMAFVPTVVGKEKAMKARIRRIITDRCGDPRVGTRWALAVSLLAVLATMGVAFAQRRPAPPEERGVEARREAREPRERQEARERIVAGRRKALERMLEETAGRIREKETVLRERGDELGEERPVIEFELELLREQAEQIERRLLNLQQPGRAWPEPPEGGRRMPMPPEPRREQGEALPPGPAREEIEAQLGNLRRHQEELAQETGRIERELQGLRDDQDEEARELRARLQELHSAMGNVEREMAELQRAHAEIELAKARERVERARAEAQQARAREATETIENLARRRRELQVRLREIQRELEERPDQESEEARALRREHDRVQEEIAATERELEGVPRARATFVRERRAQEPGRREEGPPPPERIVREPGPPALERQVDELRNQMQELREQMQQMREMLQQLVERGQNEEPVGRR